MILPHLFPASVIALLIFTEICLAQQQLRGRHHPHPASSNQQQKKHVSSSLFLESVEKMKVEAGSAEDRRLARMKLTAGHILGLLSGGHCQHLYIDLGTSTGMQIRKLYEPNLYPEAPIHEYYNKYFGAGEKRREVCAIGFEANPLHSARLQKLQSYYQGNGFPLHIFRETIVSTKFVLDTPFYLEEGYAETYHGWGSSAVPRSNSRNVTVVSIDIAALLADVLQAWSLASSVKGLGQSSLMIKMDVEGSEVILLPHLMLHGILCQVNFLSVEWHPHIHNIGDAERNATKKFFQSLEDEKVYGCGFKMMELDDETYFLGEDIHSIEA